MSDARTPITGYEQTLESGAKVLVGVLPKENRTVFLKFTNPDGIETRLFLSFQAMSAVFEIWSRISICRPSAWQVQIKEEDGSLVCTEKEPK